MIRRADLSDLDSILKLCDASAAHWPRDVYAHMLSGEGPDRLFLVAENLAGTLVGMLVVLCQTDEWELENIVVASNQRRKGIGRKLMERLIMEAKAHHASGILLEVRVSNSVASDLYQSCGFEVTAIRKSYYSNPLEDAVLMTKKIGKTALEIC